MVVLREVLANAIAAARMQSGLPEVNLIKHWRVSDPSGQTCSTRLGTSPQK